MPRGGNDSAPHAVQRSTSSRPSAAASQNGAVSSVTAGGMPVVGVHVGPQNVHAHSCEPSLA